MWLKSVPDWVWFVLFFLGPSAWGLAFGGGWD